MPGGPAVGRTAAGRSERNSKNHCCDACGQRQNRISTACWTIPFGACEASVLLQSAEHDDADWPAEFSWPTTMSFFYLAIRCRTATSDKGDSPIVADTRTGTVPARRPRRRRSVGSTIAWKCFSTLTATISPTTIWPSTIAAGPTIVVGHDTRNPTWFVAARRGKGRLDGRGGDPPGRARRPPAGAARRLGHRHLTHSAGRRLSILDHSRRRHRAARRLWILDLRVGGADPQSRNATRMFSRRVHAVCIPARRRG